MGRHCVELLVVCGVIFTLSATHQTQAAPHPCQRDCGNSGLVDDGKGGGGSKPMTCRYKWLVENYVVLSRACYYCPFNSTDCFRPDCVYADGVPRSLRTINRQLPAPDIQVCEGDTVEVEVTNQMMMSEGLTIHWHGLRQRRSQHMDGVSMVTQCPIPTFSSFTYRFQAEDPGTHFFHSHSGIYRGEGLYGPLIIRQSGSRDPQRALYDLDLPEHVITLSDWTHMPIVEFYSRFFHGRGTQSPSNILINGLGFFPILDSAATRPNDSFALPVTHFDVKSDVRYRFRVINAGALRCPIVFSIDHHSLLLIASDGQPLKPYKVSSIMIFSGERYDFVLETKKELAGLHWIRAKGRDLCEEQRIQQFAILNYTDHVAPAEQGSRFPKESTSYDAWVVTEGPHFNHWFLDRKATNPSEHAQIMNMTSLLPDDVSLQKKVDHRIMLEFAYRFRTNLHFMDPELYPARAEGVKTVSSPMVNNISNLLPPAPLLTQMQDISPELICNGKDGTGRNCYHKFCECVHRVTAQEGEVVEIVAYNSNDQYGYTHPLHLHGYGYRVVAAERPHPRITEQRFLELDKKGLIPRRLHGAPVKDTLPLPNGGYLILRIHADNPGAWFIHCHVAMHAEVGMSLTLVVTRADGHLMAPPPSFPRCGIWPKAGHSADASKYYDAPSGNGNDVKDNASKYHDAPSGNGNDVKDNAAAAATSGQGGSWVVPVLMGLVCVNVLMAVFGGFQWLKNYRRSKQFRAEGYQVMEARDTQIYSSSEDEGSDLLRR